MFTNYSIVSYLVSAEPLIMMVIGFAYHSSSISIKPSFFLLIMFGMFIIFLSFEKKFSS